MCPHDEIQVILRRMQRQFCVLGASYQEAYDVGVSFMGNINLDHLVKVMYPGFLYYKVTIFTFIICGEVVCLIFHRAPQTQMMANTWMLSNL